MLPRTFSAFAIKIVHWSCQRWYREEETSKIPLIYFSDFFSPISFHWSLFADIFSLISCQRWCGGAGKLHGRLHLQVFCSLIMRTTLMMRLNFSKIANLFLVLYLSDLWHYSNSWHCLLWDVYWSFLHFLHSVYYENFAKTVASLCPDMRVFTKKAFIRYLFSSSGLRTIIMTLLKPPSFQRGQPQQFCVQGSLSEAPLKPSLQSQPPGTASRGFFFRTSFVTQHHTLSTRWF